MLMQPLNHQSQQACQLQVTLTSCHWSQPIHVKESRTRSAVLPVHHNHIPVKQDFIVVHWHYSTLVGSFLYIQMQGASPQALTDLQLTFLTTRAIVITDA